MDSEIVFLIVILIAGVVALIFFVNKKISGLQRDDLGKESLMLQKQIGEKMLALDQKLTETRQELDRKLSETHKITKEQSSENINVVQSITRDSQEQVNHINKQLKDVTERLTKLDETNKQVMGFSQQLSSLEKILKSQKQRGNLGEAGLRLVLENILPPDAYKLQYQFDDGDTVDAAIFTKDGIIPVDAKFSLENYNRIVEETDEEKKEQHEKIFKDDLKRRIDETSKYVKPGQGTLDFAFMFIPAEAIYYDLLVNEVGAVKVNTRSLVEYAFKDKKVIIVSPTTFSAYLQTVLHGLHALKIEEKAKLIQANVEKLGKHLGAFELYHQKLGNSLGTTVNHFNKSQKELGKIDKDVTKITGKDEIMKLEGEDVDKPASVLE